MEMENELVTQSGKFWLGEDGIIRGVISSTEEHTVTFARENSEAVSKLSNEAHRPLFVDITRCKSITHEARVQYARGDADRKRLSACGILISSPVNRVIGNFFLGINKPVYPTKLFTSENEAIEWLKGYTK